jgi:hypothetical protein
VTELVREMAARVRSAVSPAPCWAGLHPWPRHVERPVHRRARPPLLRHAPEPERAASGIGRRARLEGLVHLLREDGVEHELASALPPVDPSRVLLFSDRPHQLTGHELETLGRLHLRRVEIDEVARDPEGAAAAALELIEPRCERFVIHFDVDVFDCNNAPLSEARSRRGAAFALASPSA